MGHTFQPLLAKVWVWPAWCVACAVACAGGALDEVVEGAEIESTKTMFLLQRYANVVPSASHAGPSTSTFNAPPSMPTPASVASGAVAFVKAGQILDMRDGHYKKDGSERKQRTDVAVTKSSNERIFLMVLAHAYHGSTALEGILMSSPHLATLCSSGVKQCEGGKVMERHNFSNKAGLWDYDKALEYFGQYWNLNKPVLLDKTPNLINFAENVSLGMEQAKIPIFFEQHGVQKLRQAFVLMYRPSCLWSLSSHAQQEAAQLGMQVYALSELRRYEQLVTVQAVFEARGLPTLVLSLGHLIWSPFATVQRLETFLPALGHLNANYVPVVGTDVKVKNRWKAQGSVVSFGEGTDPAPFGYNVRSNLCTKGSSVFKFLSQADARRARKAENVLRSLSHGEGSEETHWLEPATRRAIVGRAARGNVYLGEGSVGQQLRPAAQAAPPPN